MNSNKDLADILLVLHSSSVSGCKLFLRSSLITLVAAQGLSSGREQQSGIRMPAA